MTAVSKVLVQQSHLDIFGHTRSTYIDIKGWIANQNYFVDSDLTNNDFEIRSSDKNYLKAALANDCDRMASAAIESASGVQLDSNLKKSGAWGVIRTYYASFFAIHSIMRMFGVSCSQLEHAHVNKIFESAAVVGKTGSISRLEKGFYRIKVSKSFEKIYFHKLKDSHRDTWGEFLSLVDQLIDDSSNATAISKYKVQIIDVLLAVKRGITRSRCSTKGNWLSELRNSINYKHTHGVWYPYQRKPEAPNYINNYGKAWTKPLSTLNLNLSGNDISDFFEVSLLINSLFRELIISCAEKTQPTNPIFTNGSLKLINTVKAA